MKRLEEETIELDFIDHVAIRVKDLEESAEWYSLVLGLKKYSFKEWGEYPVFMMSKKFGVALFPAHLDNDHLSQNSRNVKIDHFAFNVTRENFDKAQRRYAQLGLNFEIKDHYYSDSLYTKDPDGHTVELTTLKVKEDDFYGSS